MAEFQHLGELSIVSQRDLRIILIICNNMSFVQVVCVAGNSC